MARDRIAVLVMAYGGPGRIDEVEPYLMDVRGGRATSPHLVQEIRERYARIGGRSPILELTRAQAAGVARALGESFGVYVGMRHWHPYIAETIRLLRKELKVPLIGFAGAPFTLASYLVEGGPSRDHARTKALMHSEPETWAALMDALAQIARAHLLAQAEAGVQAVQLFDSWVGALAPDDYRRSVQPWVRRVLQDLPVPSIHFGVGTGELLWLMREAGGDAIGIDWRVPLDLAWERIGADRAIQGNLDPAICTAPWEVVEREALVVLERAAMRDGHVFNLGHGVLPQTPVEHLQRLVDLVHERTERPKA